MDTNKHEYKSGGDSTSFVRMFSPQFASLVESGEKLQTIRPMPKRIPKAGDKISLRAWTGRPYWSQQRVLQEAQIVSVHKIRFMGYFFDGGPRDARGRKISLDDFAQAEGFADWTELFERFNAAYKLPFEGIVIHWKIR